MIEIPKGWRRLAKGEKPKRGDEYRQLFTRAKGVVADDEQIVFNDLVYYCQLDDQWHDHDGGECPVNRDEVVEYELRAGGTLKRRAGELRWEHYDARYCSIQDDIIRYRRHQPIPAPQPSAPSSDKTQIVATHHVELRINGEHIAGVQVVDGMLEIESLNICKACHASHLIEAIQRAVDHDKRT